MSVAPRSRHQRELKAPALAILKRDAFEDLGLAAHTMNTIQTTPVESGFRIQLPPEWAEGLGLKGNVVLTRTADGILVSPCPQATWDEIFATDLVVRPGDPSIPPEITEVTGDDLLF
jgi:hypothetical protein